MGLLEELLNLTVPNLMNSAKTGISAAWTARIQRQNRFIIDAIGPAYCLVMAEAVPGEISLESIDNRIRYDQGLRPEEARRADIPSVDDPKRRIKIKDILHRMTTAGLLRYHPVDKWSVH